MVVQALVNMRSWKSLAREHSGTPPPFGSKHQVVVLIHIDNREVHKARSHKTGALVALKKILMHNEKDGV